MMDWKMVFGSRVQQVGAWRVKATVTDEMLLSMRQKLGERIVGSGDTWGSLEPWDKGADSRERWRWGVLPEAQGAVVAELTADAGGPLILLRLRQHKSPDERLLKLRINEEMKKVDAGWTGKRTKAGKPKMGKFDREVVKDAAARALVVEAQARVSLHALVWHPQEQLLLVFGGGPKVRASVARVFEDLLAGLLGARVFLTEVGLHGAVTCWLGPLGWVADMEKNWMRWVQTQAPYDGSELVEARQGERRVRLHPIQGFVAKDARGQKMMLDGADLVRAFIDGNDLLREVSLVLDVRDELAHRPETMRVEVVVGGAGVLLETRLPKTYLLGLGMALERMRQAVLLVAGLEVLLAGWWHAAGRQVQPQESLLGEEPEATTVGPCGEGW